MKKSIRFLPFVLSIVTLLLAACGAPATPNVGGGQVEPSTLAFLGTIESMAGDQWVVNGNTITVPVSAVQDGPFTVGDQIKVEGIVSPTGSFTVSRVQAPTPQELSTLPQLGNDNSNDSNINEANGNDVNTNDINTNDANINDDNTNSVNSNDDNGNDVNTNDDNSNDTNSNDDNGDDSNSNDDNGGNNNSDDSNDNDDSGGDDDSDDDDNSND